jgi:DNA-directed RNA polymerase specialized sigma24 family protein
VVQWAAVALIHPAPGMWPPDDTLLAAWRDLVADPTCAGSFAELVLSPLNADLARAFPKSHHHDLTTAAEDALLAFFRRPAAYDPARRPLRAYLRVIARRRFANLLDREKKHRSGRIPWDAIELDLPDRNDPEDDLAFADHPRLREVIDSLPEADRRVFDLMLDGERDTAVFAAALGITDRPADEQFAEVKKAKDRIKARLKRAGGEP